LSWESLLQEFPVDLEETAKQYGALQRKRGISSASDLLRLGLAYVLTDFSLSDVACWAEQNETAYLSQEALLNRLKKSSAWFEALLGQMLVPVTPETRLNGKICIVDATSLSKPGSTGTDYRVHVNLDAGELRIKQASIYENKVGEGFSRFEFHEGDLAIADRTYGYPEPVANLVAKGVQVIVRMKCSHNGLFHPASGKKFKVLEALQTLKPKDIGDFPVVLANNNVSTTGRLIAIRQSPEATERARKKISRKSQRNSRQVSLSALEAAEYLFVFTTLDKTVSAQEILELYRIRWQVELCFKRLKSLLKLDAIPVKDPALCRSFIALKLIGSLLVQRLIDRLVGFSPSNPMATVACVS
jgi:hypothetical protein